MSKRRVKIEHADVPEWLRLKMPYEYQQDCGSQKVIFMHWDDARRLYEELRKLMEG